MLTATVSIVGVIVARPVVNGAYATSSWIEASAGRLSPVT